MALIYYALGILAVGFLLAQGLKPRQITSGQAPFPKGPKALPYLGNLHQLPLTKAFLAFTSWSRSLETSTPDGLVGLHLGPNSRAVVLNKWNHVRDLLDSPGKGAIYSDRPYVAAADYVIPNPPGTDLHLVFARYGPKWRRARKTIVDFLNDKEVVSLVEVQEAESSQMMWELLTGTSDGDAAYHRFVMRYFGAVILASVFGIRGKDSTPESTVMRFFAIQDEWAGILDQGALPPIEVFPWLRYIPDFLTPWRGWKARAEFLKKKQSSFYHELFMKTEARLRARKSEDCFMSRLIQDQARAVQSGKDKGVYTQLELDYIGGFLMEGGADTTAMAFETFILAMASFPEIQKQAQEEVDRVFGANQLPCAADAKRLPFLKACFLETLRWRPGFPTSIPHATTTDDSFQGFYIPKGTTIILNTWAISHDTEVFDDPDAFNPSRYISNRFGIKNTKDEPEHVKDASEELAATRAILGLETSETISPEISRRQTYAFGAGRRVCAGQRMAEQSMMITMAKLMWCFDILPSGTGKLDVDVSTAYKDSILTGPKLFPVKFVLREENKRDIIKNEWEKADQFLSRFE